MEIPQSAVDIVRNIFRKANLTATKAVTRNPNIWETMLDDQIISSLEAFSTPIDAGNGCLINIQTHFLGSRKMFGGWEIADIGVLIIFRVKMKLIKTKVLLLQSKRLYPLSANGEFEATPHHYRAGFLRLMPEQEDYSADIQSRVFRFDWASKYQAIKKGDEQETAVTEYQQKTGIPVFYLLYNPALLPWEVNVPLVGKVASTKYELGCRVVPFSCMQAACAPHPKNYQPSIADIRAVRRDARKYDTAGFTLEEFIADRALGCHEGYVTNTPLDESLETLFFRRSAPISAAIAITIDLDNGG